MVNTPDPTRAGLKAAGQWLGVEFAIRSLGGSILVVALSLPPVSRNALIINLVALIVAMLLLGWLFHSRIERESLNWLSLGYTQFTRSIVIAGLAAGAVDLSIVVGVTDPLDTMLFPEGARFAADLMRMTKEAGVLGAALFIPGNGILGPIIEEYAWRGYIQTKLMQGLGIRKGLVVAALLFAAKHIVVDFSVSRTATLLVGGFVLGFVRIQWGTTASTITHVVGNLVATLWLIAEASTRFDPSS